MPVDDWQFWVVTPAALLGLLLLLRPFLPRRSTSGCGSQARSRAKRSKLTIDGRAVSKGRGDRRK